MRWLVAFEGEESGEWLFVAITWARKDAELVAAYWRRSQVFDLLEAWP